MKKEDTNIVSLAAVNKKKEAGPDEDCLTIIEALKEQALTGKITGLVVTMIFRQGETELGGTYVGGAGFHGAPITTLGLLRVTERAVMGAVESVTEHEE